MPVQGDFAKLDTLIAGLRAAGDQKAMRAVGKNLAAEVTSLVQRGFESSTAPDGSAWAPLVLRDGKPLLDTGVHIRDSFSAHGDEHSIKAGFGFAFAHVHQRGMKINAKPGKSLRIPFGGSRGNGRGDGASVMFRKSVTIPARPMLPPPDAIPGAWQTAMLHAAEDVIDAIMQRAAAAQ